MRFHIHTLGCKTNLSDTLALTSRLLDAGHTRAPDPDDADLVVVNTCSVTYRADADARRYVGRVRRRNPAARVMVTGCLAERDPEGVVAWDPAIEVVGNRDKRSIAEQFGGLAAAADAADGTLWDAPTSYPQFRDNGYTRAFIKVQDGCNAHCSFCVIPQTRGASRSLALERVLESVASLGDSGASEVVLTGIHLGHYGRDIGTSLGALLERLETVERPQRIRLTSIEPNELTDDIVRRVATSERLAPHFHLPLQSGSDRILARMRRPYTSRRYARAVETIARHLPHAGIGADVIVGFPGETDADFARTVELIRSLPLTYLHVFSYSARAGTDAAAMPEQVRSSVIKDRNRVLRELGEELGARFLERLVGVSEQALVLTSSEQSSDGLTGAFLRVALPGPLEVNKLVAVRIDARDGRAHGIPLNPTTVARRRAPAEAPEITCPT